MNEQELKLEDGRTVKLRVRSPESYTPNLRNTNQGSERGKAALDDSLQTFGFHRGIVVSADDTVVNGNHAYQAASEQGVVKSWIEIEVEGDVGVVTKRVDWADAQDPKAIAAAISDNRTSELNYTIDPEAFQQSLDALLEAGVELPNSIFTQEELEAIAGMGDDEDYEGLTDEDEIPDEEQVETRVKRGEVWQLGRHRIMCGDSTCKADVEKLMDGTIADMMLTDPPYGVKRDKGFEGFGGFGKPIARRRYEEDDWDSCIPSGECFQILLKYATNSIIFGGNFFAHLLPQSTHWIFWDKLQTMPTFGDGELAWTTSDRKSIKKVTFQYNGLIGKEKERFHPTQKPVGLFESLLLEYTEPKALILDFFLGSGSTLIACEKTGRTCYGMEISEKYCDVILQRFQDFTGIEPQRID